MPTATRRTMRYDGQHMTGVQVRSSHLGYDCYLTGMVGVANGKVRMVLRPTRVSATLPQAYRAILPPEMWWPQRDHPGAHGCIDAVMTQDYKSLEQWQRTWPGHHFGFEHFLTWCQRAAANGLRAVSPQMSDLVPTFGRNGQAQSTYVPPIFPVGSERHKDLIRVIPMDGYKVKVYVVTFRDLTKALRTDVIGTLGEDKILLGRAYVDLIDNGFQVIEHHPGHCRALDLPVDLIYRTLGVKAPPDARRTVTQDRPDEELDRTLTPRQRSLQVAMRAAELSGRADENGPVDGPTPWVATNDSMGKPRPEHREEAPAPRPRREPEPDFSVFPDAPGMAGGRAVAPSAG